MAKRGKRKEVERRGRKDKNDEGEKEETERRRGKEMDSKGERGEFRGKI